MFTTSHGRERGDERSSSRISVHRDGVQLFFAAKRGKAKKLQTHKRVEHFAADSKFEVFGFTTCSLQQIILSMQIVDWEEVGFGSILWSWNIMIASLVSQPLWSVSFPKHSRPSMYPFYGATSSAFTWIKTTFLVSLVFSSDLKRRPDWMGKGVAALEWCHWFAHQTETCSRCWLSIRSVILLTLDAYTFELNSFLKAGVDSSQVAVFCDYYKPWGPARCNILRANGGFATGWPH